jgi:RNA polymerase sigma-70 factor (ECF subfamily)
VVAVVDNRLPVDALARPADELSDLARRARDGDRRALEQLLRESYDRVHPVCRRLLGNEPDAADAAQETMVSVVRGLPRFDGRSRYSTWLYRIAVNASLDELRRRRRRPAGSLRPPPDTAVEGAVDAVAGMLDLQAALAGLAPEFRAAVVLRDVCGCDYAEIAEVLGIPGGTVRSRIARGRSLLAAQVLAAGGSQ